MNNPIKIKKYSHSCVKEGARLVKSRRDNSSVISKEEFIAEVDSSDFNALNQNVGIRFNATYHRSGEVVYVDNGDMDYIFYRGK